MQSFNEITARSHLAVRSLFDSDSDSTSDDRALTGMIVLFVFVFLSLLSVSSFITFRRLKKRQQMLATGLPQYNAKAGGNNPHGLTIQTTSANGQQSVLVFNRDGQPMLANPQSPPYSPDNVPEIRITFPDEHDEAGRRKSGRVLVVRVGDHNAVGMEPVPEAEEQLPAYEKESKTQFYSIDMDQIGGLKEKDYRSYQ